MSHEWSHGLQVSVLGNKIPYGEIIRYHDERTVSNPGHAFREGFAMFNAYALWIEEIGTNFPRPTKKLEEFYKDNKPPYYRGSHPYQHTDGRIVEGAVMQFFGIYLMIKILMIIH